MNSLLRETVDASVPKFNKNVVEGIVKPVFETLPAYLDKIFRSAMKSLHEDIKLEYLGYSYVDPEEDFFSNFVNNSSKKSFDLARSDVYPIKFRFNYDGVEFDRTILLPYGRPGNLMMLAGTKYVIIPVLSDTVISPDTKQIFVRLLKDKLIFKQHELNFIVNGETTRGLLIWAEVMKNSDKSGELGRPLSCISLYLLGKYGWRGVMKRYLKMDLKGKLKREIRDDDVIITTEDLPKLKETYDVYESTKVKPSKIKVTGEYVGHDIKVYVNKELPVTPFIKSFIFGMLYSLEVLPEEAPELMNLIESGDVENEIFKWKIILGRIAYKGNYSTKKVGDDITEHFRSVENYVDDMTKLQLRDIGVYIEDFFDLLYYILSKYSEWTLSSKTYNSDIRNRYIDLKYYICYNIFLGFHKVILDLNKLKQKPNKVIREKEVLKIFKDNFEKNTIFGIVKSKQGNFNIQPPDYSGDNMYFKCTALLEDQSRGDGVAKPKKARLPESSKYLHGSTVFVGSFLFITKNTPCGDYRANVFLDFSVGSGRINITNHMLEVINTLDAKLQGKKEISNESEETVYELDYEDDLDKG